MVTVGLEMGGAEVVRPYIEAAHAEHPSLVDETHRMDALCGVTNIPQVTWIDETGTIVRPPGPGSPAPQPTDDPGARQAFEFMSRGRPSPEWYADRIRDWVAKGPDSEHALRPVEVSAPSHPRSPDVSRAAAQFELAQHLWRIEGFSERTHDHFAQAHTLQPDNITYKRQAYSAYRVASADHVDDRTRFQQSPAEGEDWPFVSDFTADMAALQAQRQREREARGQ